MTRRWAGQWQKHNSIHGRDKRFFSSTKISRIALGSTQLPILSTRELFSGCQAGLFLQVYSRWDMKLTTHFHFAPRLRMNVAIPLLLSMPSWCAQEELALHHLNKVNCLLPYLPSGHFPTSILCMHFFTLWCWN